MERVEARGGHEEEGVGVEKGIGRLEDCFRVSTAALASSRSGSSAPSVHPPTTLE